MGRGTSSLVATRSISNPGGRVNRCAPILKSAAGIDSVEPKARRAVMKWRMAVPDSSAVPRIGQADLPGPLANSTNPWISGSVVYAARVVEELSNREIRELKARAQRLKPMLKVGREGLSPAFL